MRMCSKRIEVRKLQELAIRISVWLSLALALMLAASIARAAGADRCDVEALRHYPMTDALKLRAIPLTWPIGSFPVPGEQASYDSLKAPDAEDERKWKEALARGRKTFEPQERPVLMLATIDAWTHMKDGLLNFFVLEQSIYLDEVLATLDSEGLDQYAALFREGRALFGKDYGTQQQRYYRWSDGSGTIVDPVLDAKLKDLSVRYHALPSLLAVAVSRIARSPRLMAIYEPLRAKATDDERLSYLTMGLMQCLAYGNSPNEELSQLATLPPAYERMIVVYLFEAEMQNGSVDQFFHNSSGDLAPEVVAALSEMGLTKHAKAVQRGIDLFPKPYPRRVDQRRDFLLLQGDDFKQTMEELTGIVDDGAMDPAMIRFARQANILPK